MQLKFLRSLYHTCLLSSTLVFFSLNPKLLQAKELEAGKNGVDASLPKQNPTAFVEKQGNSGEEQEAEKTILPPGSTLSKRPQPIASDLEEQPPSILSPQANTPIAKLKNSPPLIPPYKDTVGELMRDQTPPPTPPLRGEGSPDPPFLPGNPAGGLGFPNSPTTSYKGGILEILPPRINKGRVGEGSCQDFCKKSNDGEAKPITSNSSANQQEELGVKPENKAAQPTTPISVAQVPSEEKPPSLEPLPELQPLPTKPPPDQLLPPPAQEPTQSESTPEEAPATLIVQEFKFEGNTIFSDAELADKLKGYTNRRMSFAELLQARSEITKLYVEKGYTTSGAIIPQQKITNPDSAVVTIQVVEGSLERINVTGTRRLRPGYISSRLALAQTKPLNVNSLIEKLQLLQLDPIIQSLSADLQAGTRPGTNILQVKVTEADTFSSDLIFDNTRSPIVGSVRRRIVLNEANLLGFGDALSLGYTNTNGSNGGDLSYSFPVSPNDSRVILNFGITESNVIQEPFDVLDISSKYRYYELTYRHPLIRKPTEELALGLTFSHQRSQSFLGIEDIGPFPLAPGADDKGRTRSSAVRFFQEWTKRSSQEVLALRSQFSLGLDVLDATINNNGEPDSRFFAWRGQGQWARLLARDTLLLLKTDVQLSDNRLLGLEQFGIGGQATVRGYRQDYLLKDNGFLASAEVRLPILRVPEVQGLLQLAPFIDLGTAWNNGNEPSNSNIPNTLIGTGLGLLWRMGDNFTARLDFGIPLVSIDKGGDTWQENGIYFSINYSPF